MRDRLETLVAASMFLAGLASCRTAASPTTTTPPPPTASKPAPPAATRGLPVKATAKADCTELLNFVMPFAQKMLKEQRGFIPFAATMAIDGQIDGSMAFTGDKNGDVNQLIFMLELGLRQGAREGKYRATALVIDMVVVPPGKMAKQDGVAVRLDHRDGDSVIVGHPYSFSSAGELVMEAPFVNEGTHQIFPREP